MKHRDSEARDKIIPFVNDFYRDNHRSPSLRQISAFTGIPRMTVQRMLNTFADEGIIDYDGETIVTEVTNKVENEVTPVGVIGNIPCGNLSLEEEAIEEIVLLPVSLIGQGEFFILHARGDSMTGAGINDGDMVLIKKTEEAYPGQIVVAYVEGEGNTLKRFKRYGRTVFLHPENPKYTDIPMKNCKIQGVAVWIFKQVS